MAADLLSDRELEHLRRIRFCQGSRHSLSLADEGSVGYTLPERHHVTQSSVAIEPVFDFYTVRGGWVDPSVPGPHVPPWSPMP